MARLLVAYENLRAAEGCPWAIEDEAGERVYTSTLQIEVPSRTVLTPGPGNRFHAYLEVFGELDYGRDLSTIRA